MTLHTGPAKQDYGTPRIFLDAVEKRFGKIRVDLAARPDNAVTDLWIPPEFDSLKQPWRELFGDAVCWLNPPYNDIAPWAEKLHVEGVNARFLVPASVGSNWFWNHVLPYAEVYSVGRMAFTVGRTSGGQEIFLLDLKGKPQVFNRDLILAVYGPDVRRGAFERWTSWK